MKEAKPRILYFVPEWPASTSAILHSTVLAEAKYLHNNGYDTFFIGTDVSNKKAAEAEKYIKETYDIGVRVFGCNSREIPVVSNIIFARKILKLSQDIISDYRPTHVWTQLIFSSSVGRKIAREYGAISVFDVPAIFALEVQMRQGRGLRWRISRWIENRELRKSDRLAGVSHELAEYVKTLTGRNDMVVIPCCLDTEKFYFDAEARQKIRRQCGFANEEKVICYSGGVYKWQKVSNIIDVCLGVSNIGENFKFLFLSQQDEKLKQMLQEKKMPLRRYVVKSCMPHEVPQYLSAADVGIIMRDNILMNNVASPIKIGEYLGCGLAVILTDGIGDYSEMIAKAGVGCVLDDNRDLAQQIVDFIEKPNFGELREKAIAFARQNVSWDAHLDDLKMLFSVETTT